MQKFANFHQKLHLKYLQNFAYSIDILCIERPPHTTGVFKFRAHKRNKKGLKSIRVPKLTRQLLHKPKHCQSPSNCNINMPSKRNLTVHYYSQVIDRVNTIKDDTTLHVRKFNKMTQSWKRDWFAFTDVQFLVIVPPDHTWVDFCYGAAKDSRPRGAVWPMDAFTALDVHCATWDSCPGFVCSEEVAGDEVLSGFSRQSWNYRIWWLGCPFSRIAGQIYPRTLNGLGQWSNWKTCHL
jgi:hypothetical protein